MVGTDEDRIAQILETERLKWAQERHESECGLRYQGIQKQLNDHAAAMAALTGEVRGALSKIDAGKDGVNTWIIRGLIGALMIIIGTIGWMGAELYGNIKERPAITQPK